MMEANQQLNIEHTTLNNCVIAAGRAKVTMGDFTIKQELIKSIEMRPYPVEESAHMGRLSTVSNLSEKMFIILKPKVCHICRQQTSQRRLQLEACPHLKFCQTCALQTILCPKCSPALSSG